MIPDKEATTIQWGKKTKKNFSTNSCGKTRYPHAKEQVVAWPYIIDKKNWKRIKDLNVRPLSRKVLEENKEEKLHDIFHCDFLEIWGNIFFYSTFSGSLANSENQIDQHRLIGESI